MDCRDAHRFVQLRLDDEIEPADCTQLDLHLTGCAPCRSRIEREQRFELELRERLRRTVGQSAPATLRDRIGTDLATTSGNVRPAWTRAAIAAGGLFVLLGVSYNATRGPDVLRESVKRHSSNLPPDVRSVSGEVEVDRFLRQKLTYPVVVPRLDQSGLPVRLVGARLSSIHDQDVALVMYDHRGAKLSLLAFPAGRAEGARMPEGFVRRQVGNREIYVGADRGYNVVAWRDHETLYSLVSDVDPSEMVQLVAAVR